MADVADTDVLTLSEGLTLTVAALSPYGGTLTETGSKDGSDAGTLTESGSGTTLTVASDTGSLDDTGVVYPTAQWATDDAILTDTGTAFTPNPTDTDTGTLAEGVTLTAATLSPYGGTLSEVEGFVWSGTDTGTLDDDNAYFGNPQTGTDTGTLSESASVTESNTPSDAADFNDDVTTVVVDDLVAEGTLTDTTASLTAVVRGTDTGTLSETTQLSTSVGAVIADDDDTLTLAEAVVLTVVTVGIGETDTAGYTLWGDDFTRADAATLGTGYTTVLGTMGIASGRCASQGSDESFATIDAASIGDDQYVRATYYSGNFAYLAVRMTGTGNTTGGYVLAVYDSLNQVDLARWTTIPIGSDYVVLETVTGHAITSGDVFSLEVFGSTLTVRQNGTTILGATDTALTTGKPAVGGTNANGGVWDSLSAGTSPLVLATLDEAHAIAILPPGETAGLTDTTTTLTVVATSTDTGTLSDTGSATISFPGGAIVVYLTATDAVTLAEIGIALGAFNGKALGTAGIAVRATAVARVTVGATVTEADLDPLAVGAGDL